MIVLGEENIYVPDEINGYEALESPITYIPDVDGYALEVRYKNFRIAPQITVITSPTIELDGDGSTATLLSFVQATDLEGTDISDRITVEPTVPATTPHSPVSQTGEHSMVPYGLGLLAMAAALALIAWYQRRREEE